MLSYSLLAAVFAAAGSFIATPLVIRLARTHGLYCMPGRRRIHEEPVPRLGGIAIVVGALAGVGVLLVLAPALGAADQFLNPSGRILAGLVLGGAIVFTAGMVDDLRGLRPAVKLVAQLAAALIVYAVGFRIGHLAWGPSDLLLGWASLPLTVLWIVGVTNAYNLVDGMDGLATGMGLVAFGATLAAAVVLGNGEVVLTSAVLLGALVGFLPHNFNPARIFLGDSGSLFIGFNLAVLSVHGSMEGPTAVLVAVPLFALAIPLLDTFVAIARRWLRGAPLSQADSRHIHHRLLARGLSHRDSVLVLYVFAAGFAALGILLAFAPPRQVALIAAVGGLASLVLLVVGMRGLAYDEFLLAGKVIASAPRRARRVIRDKILAADLAEVIRASRSIEEVRAVLADAAEDFGLLHMQVCSESSRSGTPDVDLAPPGSVWRVDFPLCVHDCADPVVLRLSVAMGDAVRPNSAERTVYILGNALRDRIDMITAVCAAASRSPSPRAREYVAPEREPAYTA